MGPTEPNSQRADGRNDEPLPVSRKKWVLLGLGIILSVALPILVFRGVRLAESWQLVMACRWPPLALAGAFFLGTLAIRSWRWQWMLAAHQPVAYRPCLSATCVSFLANNILPFRLSDLVRVGAIRQLAGVSAARSLGTVAVERVLDILTLVVFLGGYLLLAAGEEGKTELAAWGGLAVAGGMCLVAVLFVGYRWRTWFAGVAGNIAGRGGPMLGKRVRILVERVLEGFQVFSSPGQTLVLLLLSAGLWGSAVAQYYCVGQSLGLTLEAPEYIVVLFATAIGAIIPAAPGALGTFESFASGGLYLVGVTSKENQLAYAAVLHLLEWILMNVTGLYFLLSDRLSLTTAAARGERDATETVAAG